MTDDPALTAAAEALRKSGLLNNAGYIDGDEERAAQAALAAAGPLIRAAERARSGAELESLREQREALLAENAYLSEQLDLSRAMGSRLAEIPERSQP